MFKLNIRNSITIIRQLPPHKIISLIGYCTKFKVFNKSKQDVVTNTTQTTDQQSNKKSILFKKDSYTIKDKHYESYNESWFDFKGFEKIPTISSGVVSLDYQLRIGGLPINHITEIYGDSSTGKSSFSMFILSNLSNDTDTLYIDSENSFNSEWASKIGVNLNKCTVFQPNNSEEAFELIKKSLENKLFKVIILDSLSSLMSIGDINNSLDVTQGSGSGNNGSGFNWISSNLNEISNLIGNSNCCLIFTNQMRYSFNVDDKDDDVNETIKQHSIGQLTSFANSILNKYVDIAIELQKDRFLLDTNNNVTGIKTFLTIKKNRLSNHCDNINNLKYQKQLLNFQPFIDINFEKGILKESEYQQLKINKNDLFK